jgi:hypothetical protein
MGGLEYRCGLSLDVEGHCSLLVFVLIFLFPEIGVKWQTEKTGLDIDFRLKKHD